MESGPIRLAGKSVVVVEDITWLVYWSWGHVMLQPQGVDCITDLSEEQSVVLFPCVPLSRQQKPDGGHPGGAPYRPGGRPDPLH